MYPLHLEPPSHNHPTPLGHRSLSWAPCAIQQLPTNYSVHGSVYMGFPGGSDGKESAYNAGDPGSIPGSERSPGECIYVTATLSIRLTLSFPQWVQSPVSTSESLLCACWSASVGSDSVRSCGLQPVWLLCPWNSPGKNTGVGSHSLLQGIFSTQGSNLGLPHWKQIFFFTIWATRDICVNIQYLFSFYFTLYDRLWVHPYLAFMAPWRQATLRGLLTWIWSDILKSTLPYFCQVSPTPVFHSHSWALYDFLSPWHPNAEPKCEKLFK